MNDSLLGVAERRSTRGGVRSTLDDRIDSLLDFFEDDLPGAELLLNKRVMLGLFSSRGDTLAFLVAS